MATLNNFCKADNGSLAFVNGAGPKFQPRERGRRREVVGTNPVTASQ